VKIAMNEVTEASTPAQISTASVDTTPSSGRNNGMMGLRMLNAMLITNWTPTTVHSVRCQCCASGGVAFIPFAAFTRGTAEFGECASV